MELALTILVWFLVIIVAFYILSFVIMSILFCCMFVFGATTIFTVFKRLGNK